MFLFFFVTSGLLRRSVTFLQPLWAVDSAMFLSVPFRTFSSPRPWPCSGGAFSCAHPWLGLVSLFFKCSCVAIRHGISSPRLGRVHGPAGIHGGFRGHRS